MTHLYHLTARYQELLEKEELSAAECQELEAIHASAEDHCIDRSKYIRNLEAERMAVEVAIEEMQDREETLANQIAAQENKLMRYMEHHKLDKITKSPLFPIKLFKNKPAVDDYDRDAIPIEYWRESVTVSTKPDKEAIKAAIESGKEVPGARLITRTRLSFK